MYNSELRRVRSLAARQGFALRVCRRDGTLSIVQADRNWLIDYRLDLEQVLEFLESRP